MAENVYEWRFESPEIKAAKLKEPYVTVMSKGFALLIGQVLIAWSEYERYFEGMAGALLSHAAKPVKNWDRLGYPKKADRVIAVLREAYPDHPALVEKLSLVVEDSRDMNIRRNALAHGIMLWTGRFSDGAMRPCLEVRGKLRAGPVTHVYTEDGLEDLVYDLMHLAGRMGEFLSAGTVTDWLATQLPSADISLLQDIRASRMHHHPAT